MNNFSWNYKVPIEYIKDNDLDFQNDWNQTLMTTLNVIIHSENLLDINVICLTPNKYQVLIESLFFYDKETMMYKNYKFEFIESNDNVIKINNNIELKILNYENN